MQREVRALEDRSGPHGELEPAGVAGIEAVFALGYAFLGLALGTDRAVRPESSLDISHRRGFIRKKSGEFKSTDGGPAHLASLISSRMPYKPSEVKRISPLNIWWKSCGSLFEWIFRVRRSALTALRCEV